MSARFAPWAALLLVAAFFAPMLARGRVIHPHDNARELGVFDTRSDPDESNARFSDESSVFVPELTAHLHGARSGWITTWTNAVQLGRPTLHLYGLSPVWFPTWALSKVFGDARVLYTVLTVLAVAAVGLFSALFLRSIGLAPWAVLAASITIATSVPVLYWATFSMCAFGFAWTWCLLWLVTRRIDAPHPLQVPGIALAVNALLLTAYPQHLVWHGLYLVAWTVHRACARHAGWSVRLRALGGVAVAVVLGCVTVLPLALDLALAAQRSTRLGLDVAFFVEGLPTIESLGDAARELVLLFDPALFGAPASSAYPVESRGVAIGPVLFAALCVAWGGGAWRAHALECTLIAVCIAFTLVKPLYAFGVEHLALGISRVLPLWGAVIPGSVIAARGLDRCLRGGGMKRIELIAAATMLAALAWGASASFSGRAEVVSWLPFLLSAVVVTLLAFRPLGPAVVVIAVVAAFVEGPGNVLEQPLKHIQSTSPLVEGLRQRTSDGSRYAVVGAEPRFVLPPNQELALGLSSVHSYEPMTPRLYLDWVQRVSRGGPRAAGRKFARITDASLLDTGELEKAGVSTVLSARPIEAQNLALDGRLEPFFVWRTKTPARLLGRHAVDGAGAPDLAVDLDGAWITVDRGDEVRLALDPSDRATIVRLARQHHPQWIADGGETLAVGGFWQGVKVPAGATEVVLSFRPWVAWSWIAWPAFALAFAWAAFVNRRRAA